MAKDNIISVMKRYELKFHLTKKQVERFKTRILGHMEIDRYGQTTISSLYFDTPSFSLINRSIEKPLFKEKIRLRSYGLASKTSPVFLEIKRKNEKIVYKRRITTSEEAYRKQKRFITNASHELKTPLTVISADLDLVEMDNGKSEWTESIRDQLARLTEMTNQLVSLSKLEEEDPKQFPFADFSVNEVCKNAADSFVPSFKKEGIKFSYNIAGNPTMFGNRRLIEELVQIFLDNSLKYTGGENKSSYFVVSQTSKGQIEFRFSNTIDKEEEVDVKQIMERFYRSPSNKKEGSGIGLSIAQGIISLHKGKIDIEKTASVISFLIRF